MFDDDSIQKIAIVGPTAIGKTALAIRIAEKIESEVVSVDSMQVYRHMDIGTAKPIPEELQLVPHHLIDIADPDDAYHAGRFVVDATKAVRGIALRGRIPLLVGGTGLYLKSFMEGISVIPPTDEEVRAEVERRFEALGSEVMHRQLAEVDPKMALKIHPNDSQRIKRGLEIFGSTGRSWSDHLKNQKKSPSKNCLIIGLTADRKALYERIDRRSALMVERGLVEEVQKLLDMGYSANLNSMQSLGYRHIIEFLAGRRNMQDTIDLLARDTRRYAKRQYTWFNRVHGLEWCDYRNHNRIIERIMAFLDN